MNKFALASAGSIAIVIAAAAVGQNKNAVSKPGGTKAGARLIEELTPAQRNSLPDGTKVKFKSGRVSTLGVLRFEHRMRVERFDRAASSQPGIVHEPAQHGALVAMKAITTGPLDYKSFCNAAHASGCLWFPPSPSNPDGIPPGVISPYGTPNVWVDEDAFVTDAKLCESEGGSEASDGCYYEYPASYDGAFNPGTPRPGQPIGTGVTSAQECSSKITVTVDPHGAVQIAAPVAAGTGHLWNTGAAPVSCVVKVYLPPSTK